MLRRFEDRSQLADITSGQTQTDSRENPADCLGLEEKGETEKRGAGREGEGGGGLHINDEQGDQCSVHPKWHCDCLPVSPG